MAPVVYKKYEAKNLNPNYKIVEEAPNDNYRHISSNGYFLDFSFDEDTGEFILSNKQEKPDVRGTFYTYYGLTKNLIVQYDRFKYASENFHRTEAQLVYKSAPVTPKYTRGDYLGEVIAEDGNYPRYGEQGGFWYEWDRYANRAPVISGYDLDLGAKAKDFQVEYLVQDEDGDDVTVEIKIDNEIKQSPTKTTLGVRRYVSIPIKDYGIGRHTIYIKATDSKGESATRTYNFSKVNSAPVISGQDTNLGSKNSSFTYTYTVTDNENDKVDVVEKFNGEVIRTLNNVTLGSEYQITITDEQIRNMELYQFNTIEIEATDGKATTFRRVTFIRNNVPPIISDKDKDLGEVTNSLEYSWSATDPEKDKMTATVYLDNKVIKPKHTLSEGANQTLKIDGIEMFKIDRGKHRIRIVVEDDKGFSSTRTVSFTRVVDKLVMQLAHKGVETDELATRVNITSVGVYVAKGADIKYEVCNNSFDEEPTWEDATSAAQAGKAYNFVNQEKVNDKAGVNIRITITRNDASNYSYISATGGAYD